MSNLELSDVQQWLLKSARPFLVESAQKQRAGLSQIQQALLQQQIEWRKRSRFRFPDPELWLWSDRSLSQASDWLSASFKAALFPNGELVLDACCGAGVDSVAAALRGPVIAVDQDPWMAALSASNASAHGQQIQTFCEQLTEDSLRGAKWMHVDPDRRPGNFKTLEADEFSPSIESVIDLAQRVEGAIVKTAPSTRFSPEMSQWIDLNCSRVWLGSFGECRQQLLLIGKACQSELLDELPANSDFRESQPQSIAVVLNYHHAVSSANFTTQLHFADKRRDFVCEAFRCESMSPSQVDIAEEVGKYVYDLHSVLHAANLHEAWADANQLSAITDPRGYYTGKEQVNSQLAQCFQVIEELTWDDRKIRKWLRSRSVGNVEIKCRLHTLDASALQKRYSCDQGEPITLLVTRLGNRVRAIACRRISNRSE